MKVIETEYFIEFQSADNRGIFRIQIQKNGSQLRIDTEDGDVYFDTNFEELKSIRDCLSEVIESSTIK